MCRLPYSRQHKSTYNLAVIEDGSFRGGPFSGQSQSLYEVVLYITWPDVHRDQAPSNAKAFT
jgi:hypothetical protein